MGSAEEPPNDPEHGDDGGSNGEDREGVESPASVGGRLAEAELGSTTSARVGHLGAGRDVEMADIGRATKMTMWITSTLTGEAARHAQKT